MHSCTEVLILFESHHWRLSWHRRWERRRLCIVVVNVSVTVGVIVVIMTMTVAVRMVIVLHVLVLHHSHLLLSELLDLFRRHAFITLHFCFCFLFLCSVRRLNSSISLWKK